MRSLVDGTADVLSREGLVACLADLRAFARILAVHGECADRLVRAAIGRARTAGAPAGASGLAGLFAIVHDLHQGAPVGIALPGDASPRGFAAAFWKLRCEQREVLILHGVAGLSGDQIAAVCGCPVATIELRLAGARRALRLTRQPAAQAVRRPAAPISVRRKRQA